MLRLAKLPDRTPVKITISLSPDLHQALRLYAVLYEETYGEMEAVADLIPFMLDSFLKGDRAFAQARKRSPAEGASERTPRGACGVPPASSKTSTEA
jgi:hypothetical protein